MADLSLPVAQGLVGYLVAIGHPYQPAAVTATAMLLIKWCKGSIVNGVPWNPEQQATALVEEAAETWDGWPEKGGTKQLLDLFRTKFAKSTEPWSIEKSDREHAERIASMIKRGLLAPPCDLCREEGADHCEWGGLKRHRYENDKQARAAAERPAKKTPAPPADYDALAANAQRVYEDEQRRKREQLERVGCD